MKTNSNTHTLDQLIESKHGKIGTESRNKYEEQSQMFIITEMQKEADKEAQISRDIRS